MLQREILHRARLEPATRAEVRQALQQLLEDGRLRRVRGGKLVAAPREATIKGSLERHRRGYARLIPDSGGEQVWVSARSMADARPGDRVMVRVVGRGPDGHLRGAVAEVLAPAGDSLYGIFSDSARGGVIVPLNPTLGKSIHVPSAFRAGAKDLTAVRFEIARGGRSSVSREARVLELLGHLDDPGTDTLVVTRKYGLPTEFPADVLSAAAELPQAVRDSDAKGRERFDNPAPVTIDGETARDFDDAIAVEKLKGGGFRLYVHIADVAHFVTPGSVLDGEARGRGTSVYFPDRVLPMFPERISNDLCSLKPGEDRLVQSAILDLAPSGDVEKVRFADGIICSAARLTYTDVAAVLDGEKNVKGVPKKVRPMLQIANELRSALESRRRRRGSIDFDFPEPQILLDVEGAMTGIAVQPRNRAHLMIEEFMLLANEAVAGELQERERACMYRVHEAPGPEKLDALSSFVSTFGLEFSGKSDTIEPADIQRLVASVEGRPEQQIVAQVVLRSMQQARYSINNAGHFGLAAPVYCHFTSPIRRYPDLMVHRQLRLLRHGKPEPEMDLEAIATTSSERERKAEQAERELLAWKKVAFIADQVGECFEGRVTGVTNFGLFVQIVENLVEGLIRIEALGDEWFEFDEKRFELRGSRSGKKFRLGDRFEIRVDRVDRTLQRVDFSLAEGGPSLAPRRRERGKKTRGRRR